MNTQHIPPINSLLAKMPSGREIHTIQPFSPPTLERGALEAMRAPPEGDEDFGDEMSSDDDVRGLPSAPAGEYSSSSTPSNSYY